MIELQLLLRHHLREYPSVIYTPHTFKQTPSDRIRIKSNHPLMFHAWNLNAYSDLCSCFLWTFISSKVHHTTRVPWNAMFSKKIWSLWSGKQDFVHTPLVNKFPLGKDHHLITHVRQRKRRRKNHISSIEPCNKHAASHTWYPLKKSNNQNEICRVQQSGESVQQVQYGLNVFALVT